MTRTFSTLAVLLICAMLATIGVGLWSFSLDKADRLREEIAGRLTALVDPASGARAIKRVYISAKVYRGPYKENGPDLVVAEYRQALAERQRAEHAGGPGSQPSASD